MITFVGRPLDSAKALTNLFAALRIVHRFSDLPTFQTWIIGGGEDDRDRIQSTVEKVPELRDIQSRGLLLHFGKVAYDALPEFYSRSTLLVVPSWFETFGRVAVEAMSCGCPVIAADATGLRETVLHGMTGLLYPATDISSLAAILVDCLAFPRRVNAWSSLSRQWTSKAFSLDQQFAAYGRLYQGADKVLCPTYMAFDTPMRRFQDVVGTEFIVSVEALLGQPANLLSWESHPHHLTAYVQSGRNRYLAMRYQNIGESAPTPHFLSQISQRTGSPARRIAKVERILAALSLSMPLTHRDREDGIALFPEEICDRLQGGGKVHLVPQGAGEKFLPRNAEERFRMALAAFSTNPGQQTLAAVDAAGSDLDVILEGGPGDLRMRHPQVEMYRLCRYFDAREPLLDLGFVSMARCLLDVLAHRRFLMPESMSLQRFDGVGPHYTGHLPLLMVLDECAFAAGPLNWAQRQVKRLESGENVRLVIGDPAPGRGDDATLGVLWLIVLLIFLGISANAEGHSEVPIRLNAIMEQIVQMSMAGDLAPQAA